MLRIQADCGRSASWNQCLTSVSSRMPSGSSSLKVIVRTPSAAGKHHRRIGLNEFGQHLPAGAARRAGQVIQIGNGDGIDRESSARIAKQRAPAPTARRRWSARSSHSPHWFPSQFRRSSAAARLPRETASRANRSCCAAFRASSISFLSAGWVNFVIIDYVSRMAKMEQRIEANAF